VHKKHRIGGTEVVVCSAWISNSALLSLTSFYAQHYLGFYLTV